MENFSYQNRTRIIYGRNSQRCIGSEIKKIADKVLLHFGGGSIVRSGLYGEVVESLKANGVEIVELSGVVPNPRLSLVKRGIEICRKEKISLVLAVGGGSVVDSAKAIAAGTPEENGDLWDIFITRRQLKRALDVATILTLPATGSESSTNTVITNDENQSKLGYGSELLRPVFSVINPELFFSLPKSQFANGVCDMMCHIFERYFTQTPHVDLTDALCEATLRTIISNAKVLLKDLKNYDAWAEIGLAGTIAHNNLLGIGRVQDWASHGMEHEISAIYDVAHGAGLAVIMPNWMRYVFEENTARFVQFAHNVMEVPADFAGGDAKKIALEGISRLRDFWSTLGLPRTLKELGINDDSRFLEMAKKAVLERSRDGKEIPQGNFKKLYFADIVKIYESAR